MTSRARSRRTAVLEIPLLHVTRRGDRHTVHDHRVDVRLDVHADGDPVEQTVVVRAVHALALELGSGEQELFAAAVARHLVQRTTAASAEVEVRSRGWERVTIGGRERSGDLTAPSALLRVAVAVAGPERETLSTGLRGLRLLSPGESEDVLLELELEALWRYGWADVPYDTQWQQVRRALSEAYAERAAASGATLAETLARAVLDQAPVVSEMQVTLRETRRLAVDTDVFGIENNGALFGAADAQRALYEVRLGRDVVTEIT